MTSTAKEMKEPPVYPIEVGQDNPEKLNYYISALKIGTRVSGIKKEPDKNNKHHAWRTAPGFFKNWNLSLRTCLITKKIG